MSQETKPIVVINTNTAFKQSFTPIKMNRHKALWLLLLLQMGLVAYEYRQYGQNQSYAQQAKASLLAQIEPVVEALNTTLRRQLDDDVAELEKQVEKEQRGQDFLDKALRSNLLHQQLGDYYAQLADSEPNRDTIAHYKQAIAALVAPESQAAIMYEQTVVNTYPKTTYAPLQNATYQLETLLQAHRLWNWINSHIAFQPMLFNPYKAIIAPSQTILQVGDTLHNKIYLAPSQSPIDHELRKISVATTNQPDTILPLINNRATYQVVCKDTGTFELSGKLIPKPDPYGSRHATYPFQLKYTVTEPCQ